jgi:transcription elongation factor GreA
MLGQMTRRQEEPLPHPARERLLAAARDGEVEVGERVTVLDLTTGAVSDYRIVRSAALDPNEGEISPASPLGSALVGRHVGDVVEIAARGRSVRLEVVEIDG